MNEFMMWDKIEKEWLTTGNMPICSMEETLVFDFSDSNEESSHLYIGKTDIYGNKIYADSSIVEFEYYDMDVDSGWVKAKSVITFDDEDLMYLIAIDGELCNFKQHDIVNLRVIGTLQENPELLGDNK